MQPLLADDLAELVSLRIQAKGPMPWTPHSKEPFSYTYPPEARRWQSRGQNSCSPLSDMLWVPQIPNFLPKVLSYFQGLCWAFLQAHLLKCKAYHSWGSLQAQERPSVGSRWVEPGWASTGMHDHPGWHVCRHACHVGWSQMEREMGSWAGDHSPQAITFYTLRNLKILNSILAFQVVIKVYLPRQENRTKLT